jgi:hypothetical protein
MLPESTSTTRPQSLEQNITTDNGYDDEGEDAGISMDELATTDEGKAKKNKPGTSATTSLNVDAEGQETP